MPTANLTNVVMALRCSGAQISTDGEKVLVRAPAEVYTPELRAILVSQKEELLELLTHTQTEPNHGSRLSTDARCHRCSGHTFREIPIHDGASIRRDCAVCGCFVDFSVWYGVDQLTPPVS